MYFNTPLETYTTLFRWNLARRKYFVSMILGIVSSGSVKQHKTAIGFSGSATQLSVCSNPDAQNFVVSDSFFKD
jgi:hypothetical protein